MDNQSTPQMIRTGGYEPSSDESPASEEQIIALAHELAIKFEELPAPGMSPEMKEYAEIFDQIFKELPTSVGKTASRAEREREGYKAPALVYGEISFAPFAALLADLRDRHGAMQTPGGLFVDVGCGVGKPAAAAALCHDWGRCVGIEVLRDLHALTARVEAEWEKAKPRLPEAKQKTELTFIHGDATALEWGDAELVFMNSTCFDDGLMARLAHKAQGLAPGSLVVTTTRRLPSTEFEVVDQCKMKESWGEATVYVQRRKQATTTVL